MHTIVDTGMLTSVLFLFSHRTQSGEHEHASLYIVHGNTMLVTVHSTSHQNNIYIVNWAMCPKIHLAVSEVKLVLYNEVVNTPSSSSEEHTTITTVNKIV